MKATKTWLISAAALALTACGGGSNNTTTPSATLFPVESVIANLYSTAQTFSATFNYTDNAGAAHTQTIAWSYAPGTSTLFEGSMRATTTQTQTITTDGVLGTPSTGITYYSTGPLKTYGWTCNDGSCYGVQNTAVTLPASSAVVGTIGTAGNATDYTSSAKTTVKSTSIDTASLNTDTATTAWLCLDSVTQDTGVIGTRSFSECYKIDTAGAIHGAKLILKTVQGVTVTYQ
jgi:hypothetical protein